MRQNMHKAIVADDQAFFAAGISAILEKELGYTAIHSASHYADLLALVLEHPEVSLLVFSLNLPGSAGLQSVRELRGHRPDLRIAVLSEHTETREVLTTLASGANGLISRQVGRCDELLQALRTIDDAGIFVPADLALRNEGGALENLSLNHQAMSGLTDRQQQVIALVFAGKSNKVIARKLGISPSTVKVHVHAAFRTLGVHSRLGAMAALRPNMMTGALIS